MAQTKKKTGKKATTKKASAKETLTKADRWKGFPIGRLNLGASIEMALAAPPEDSKLPAIETLGDLAAFTDGENPSALLCAFPGIGGTRADAILGKLQGVRAACENIAKGGVVDPVEREAITGDRNAVLREGPKNADGVTRLEVKPGRSLSWPWPPFEQRSAPGDILLEDDPLIDPTEETLEALREAGFQGATKFDQRHKLWVAESERQSEGPTPVNSRLGARVFGALDYDSIDTSVVHAPRGDLRRSRPRDAAAAENRTSPAPAPTAADPNDLDVPSVDDFADLDEAIDGAAEVIGTPEIPSGPTE